MAAPFAPQSPTPVKVSQATIDDPNNGLPRKKEPSPTFKNLYKWLTNDGEGRLVEIYAAPQSDFTRTYCVTKHENDVGVFSCKLLDITLDPVTFEPLTAIVEFTEKNARKFYSVNVLNLKGTGCQISIPMELDLPRRGDGATGELQPQPTKQ